MKNKIILTDCNFLENENYRKIFVFNHLKINYSKNVTYLSKYLDQNSDKYKKIYLSFYDDILKDVKKNIKKFQINQHFNSFISSLFFEKSPFKTNIFIQLQLIVLWDLLKKEKNPEIILLVKNKELKTSIEYLLSHLQNQNYQKKFFILKFEVNYILSLIYSFYKIFYLLFKKNNSRNKKFNRNIFFSTYNKTYNPKFDSYWKNILITLKESSYNIFLLDYENFYLSKKFYKNVFYSSDFFKFKDFIFFIKIYFFLNKFTDQLKCIKNIFSKSKFSFLYPLVYYDMKKSIKGAVWVENYYNNKTIHNFKMQIRGVNHNQKLFYPCEFHPYENFISQPDKLITTHGFVHSTLRYWLLNYFFSKKFFSISKKIFNIPDLILVNGHKPFKEMRKYINSKNLKQVEAIRHLENFNTNDKINNKVKNISRIFYGDIQSNSTLKMINMITNNQKIKEFTYKPHPFCKLKLKRDKFKTKIKFIDKHSKLTDQYNSYLFGSTSLALDFYLKNKNIVIFKDEVNLNLSPLFDYVTKKFSDHETYNIIKNNKYGKKYFFNLNPKLKMWKKIINC